MHARDILDFLNFIRGHPGLDTDNLVLIGHSCSAHMIASIAMNSAEPALVPDPAILSAIKAIVCSEGIFDLDALLTTFPGYREYFVAAAFGDNTDYAKYNAAGWPLREGAQIEWLLLALARGYARRCWPGGAHARASYHARSGARGNGIGHGRRRARRCAQLRRGVRRARLHLHKALLLICTARMLSLNNSPSCGPFSPGALRALPAIIVDVGNPERMHTQLAALDVVRVALRLDRSALLLACVISIPPLILTMGSAANIETPRALARTHARRELKRPAHPRACRRPLGDLS